MHNCTDLSQKNTSVSTQRNTLGVPKGFNINSSTCFPRATRAISIDNESEGTGYFSVLSHASFLGIINLKK